MQESSANRKAGPWDTLGSLRTHGPAQPPACRHLFEIKLRVQVY